VPALITGAGGFVGRHLATLLRRDGIEHLVGIEARPVAAVDDMEMITCDLLDRDHVGRVIAHYRPQIIFHLAAQAYVPKAVAAPAETLINNAVAQINVLEASRASCPEAIIVVVGSSEEYGLAAPDDMPLDEDQPFRPTNAYAVSKIAQDMLGLQYHLSYGSRVVRVRPFNHIGPGQSDRFVVSSMARQIAEAEAGRADPVILVGNLQAERDFLDVRDVVSAYALVARAEFSGQVFNVASGIPRPIGALLERLVSMAQCEILVREDPSRLRASDVPVVFGDAARLRLQTGWEPRVKLERSLSDTLDYWRLRVRTRV